VGAQFSQEIHLVYDAETVPGTSGLGGRMEQVPISGADDLCPSRDRRCDYQIIVRILCLDGCGGLRCHDQGTRLQGLKKRLHGCIVESVQGTHARIL